MNRWQRFQSFLWLAALATPALARAQESARDDAAAAASPAWALTLSAEAGVGARDVDLPRDGVIYQVRTGVYPALGVGFQLLYRSSPRFGIGLTARYQTSLGLVLHEQLTDETEHPRKTRSHVFALDITPTWFIGSGWALIGALGYSVTELDPFDHLETPAYHLGGPHAGVALQIPLGSERVRIALGVEGQLTLQVGDELAARGASARGWGAGASAALEISVSRHWAVALSYRELHYWLGSQQSADFADGLRFATAQLRGTL